MSTTIKLSDDLINEAKHYAAVYSRSAFYITDFIVKRNSKPADSRLLSSPHLLQASKSSHRVNLGCQALLRCWLDANRACKTTSTLADDESLPDMLPHISLCLLSKLCQRGGNGKRDLFGSYSHQLLVVSKF